MPAPLGGLGGLSGADQPAHRLPRRGPAGSAPSLALPTLCGIGDSEFVAHASSAARHSSICFGSDAGAPCRQAASNQTAATAHERTLDTTLVPVPASATGAGQAPQQPQVQPQADAAAALAATRRADAASTIQSAWQRWWSQRCSQRAVLLQCLLRAALERQHLGQQAAAAISVQRLVRVWRGRRLRMQMRAQVRAAIRIQRCVRKWREKLCIQRALELARRLAVDCVQQAVTAALNARQCAAAVQLQRVLRGAWTRDHLEAEGLLLAASECSHVGGRAVKCFARRQVRRDSRRILRAQGWAIVASSGGSERNPLWRVVLEVSAADALSRFQATRLSENSSMAAARMLGKESVRPVQKSQKEDAEVLSICPAAVSRRLLEDIVVNLSNGQLSLHLEAMDCIDTSAAGKGRTAGEVDEGAAVHNSELGEATEAAELAGDGGAARSGHVAEGVAADAGEEEDIVGNGFGPLEEKGSARLQSACPAWCCSECGFKNEVSPETCVLCDAQRQNDAEPKVATGAHPAVASALAPTLRGATPHSALGRDGAGLRRPPLRPASARRGARGD